MKNKVDPYFEHLQKFPLSYSYFESKECLISMIEDEYDPEDTIPYCDEIEWIIQNYFVDEMLQNGMDKAVNNIVVALFLIEHKQLHNELDAILLYDAYLDMLDLDTGKYDDLFTKDDLKLLKEDIAVLKEFFEKHPKFTDVDYNPEEDEE